MEAERKDSSWSPHSLAPLCSLALCGRGNKLEEHSETKTTQSLHFQTVSSLPNTLASSSSALAALELSMAKASSPSQSDGRKLLLRP